MIIGWKKISSSPLFHVVKLLHNYEGFSSMKKSVSNWKMSDYNRVTIKSVFLSASLWFIQNGICMLFIKFKSCIYYHSSTMQLQYAHNSFINIEHQCYLLRDWCEFLVTCFIRFRCNNRNIAHALSFFFCYLCYRHQFYYEFYHMNLKYVEIIKD